MRTRPTTELEQLLQLDIARRTNAALPHNPVLIATLINRGLANRNGINVSVSASGAQLLATLPSIRP